MLTFLSKLLNIIILNFKMQNYDPYNPYHKTYTKREKNFEKPLLIISSESCSKEQRARASTKLPPRGHYHGQPFCSYNLRSKQLRTFKKIISVTFIVVSTIVTVEFELHATVLAKPSIRALTLPSIVNIHPALSVGRT